MGIVILRSMGGVHLAEEQMQKMNLAEKEEIRRIINRSFRDEPEAENRESASSDLRGEIR